MDSDAVEFTYQGVKLAYSKLTGKCWRVDGRNGSWRLITPGTLQGKYTQLKIGASILPLHRIVAEVYLNSGKPLTPKQVVDHREHVDGTHRQDRLINLRVCSNAENARNQKPSKSSASKYKGAYLDKRSGKWTSKIQLLGRVKHLGTFTTPEKAARAYDAAAVQLFGEFALTNERLGTLKHVNKAQA